eukprot:CAMPEP_0197426942 /NCGR_PEP_ID=MMETSP1170-20131217/36714_1 /TAXON_ID=54406 /ORGANISM="Sarcinochrysis sp, Strain CCMP770" /LENGTH=46 /DNA_ID= /DNA_START= /DNA_END= /DNA_ORIENTATION=
MVRRRSAQDGACTRSTWSQAANEPGISRSAWTCEVSAEDPGCATTG